MSMTHQRADTTLTAALKGAATPHIWLHTGSPGADGTANVAQTSAPANIVRKAIAFGAIGNHATNTERRVLSDGAVEWTGAQIASGQTITHFSIWSADTAGNVEFISTVAADKTTGSDGVTIATTDVEVAIGVFVKPA
jgi:Fe-S cluster assembly scaffold protein SufB